MTRKRYGKYVSRVGSAGKAGKARKKKRYGGSAVAIRDAQVDIVPPSAVSAGNLAGVATPEPEHEFDFHDDDEDPDFMELLHHAHSEMRSFGEHNALHINHGFDPQMAYVMPQNIDTKSMAEAIRDKHLGGGLWEDIQHGVADGLAIGGSMGQIVGGATAGIGTALIATPVGAPLIAAGAGMFAVGTGAKLTGELAGSHVKTPGVNLGKFVL
jgi:hypothetical protein